MPSPPRFPPEVLAAARKDLVIGLRAGTQPHRFIAVWAVVVEGRLFIRSWSLKPDGWTHAFRADPRGTVQVAGREYPVRAIRTRSDRLKDLVSRAYREKYHTPASRQYVREMSSPKSRATTTEVAPLPSARAGR